MKKQIRLFLLSLLMLSLAAIPATGLPDATEVPGPELTARGYVLISAATVSGWLPLPEEEDVIYPLRQVIPGIGETENVIHLTPEGVYIEEATCENHDCVEQGIVTLENRSSRVLGNMIICLPNQVFLELFTPEEVLEMIQAGAPAP